MLQGVYGISMQNAIECSPLTYDVNGFKLESTNTY